MSRTGVPSKASVFSISMTFSLTETILHNVNAIRFGRTGDRCEQLPTRDGRGVAPIPRNQPPISEPASRIGPALGEAPEAGQGNRGWNEIAWPWICLSSRAVHLAADAKGRKSHHCQRTLGRAPVGVPGLPDGSLVYAVPVEIGSGRQISRGFQPRCACPPRIPVVVLHA